MNRISHSHLLTALESHACENADKTALISGDSHVSYGNLWKSILTAARYLQDLGFVKGDTLILATRKEIEFVYLYYASHLIGAVNVLVDSAATTDKIKHIVNLTSPKAVFGLGRTDDESLRIIKYADIDFEEGTEPIVEYALSPQDTADIMFTTGTTSLPKGVCLSHANIAGSASNINSFIGNGPDEVEILGLPLSHSFGLGRMRCTLLNGATMVLLGNFANLKLFFQYIEQYEVTGFGMVPAVWEYISKLSGDRIAKYSEYIRYMEIGSASLPRNEKDRLLRLFPKTRICMHYGSTEASRSLFTEFSEYKDNLDSIGRPVCDKVAVRIMDEDGNELPAGEFGEICVKGNMVMKGYLLPKDNQGAFHGDFFRTGDYGRFDEYGNFYLVGRGKEIINIGGKKVSPALIEEAIKSLGVMDCACVPIKDPKGILGEVGKAYIQKSGCCLGFKEIKKGLENILEPYEIPVEYEWVDRIPRTSTGKIQRTALMN